MRYLGLKNPTQRLVPVRTVLFRMQAIAHAEGSTQEGVIPADRNDRHNNSKWNLYKHFDLCSETPRARDEYRAVSGVCRRGWSRHQFVNRWGTYTE